MNHEICICENIYRIYTAKIGEEITFDWSSSDSSSLFFGEDSSDSSDKGFTDRNLWSGLAPKRVVLDQSVLVRESLIQISMISKHLKRLKQQECQLQELLLLFCLFYSLLLVYR